MKEAVERGLCGPSMWFGDSGCVVFSPAGARHKTMLEAISIDLKIKFPLIECIKPGARVEDFIACVEEYTEHGLRDSQVYDGVTVGQQLDPRGVCK